MKLLSTILVTAALAAAPLSDARANRIPDTRFGDEPRQLNNLQHQDSEPASTTGLSQEPDSMTVDMNYIVVMPAAKESKNLRELPVASSSLDRQQLSLKQISGIKSLSSVVPNLFIPDYGSRMTTAVYIRGIGSRINTPAVGLYVDDIPYIDKSAFDFNYSDIEQIEVLRGPQSLLYGRNTMGGVIKVRTKSPFTYQGTDLRLGLGTHDNYTASLTHYHRISNRFAFSAGGFYEHAGGFFKNITDNSRIDRSNTAGGRLHALMIPSDNLKIDINVNFEHLNQGGYPYIYLGPVPSSGSSTDENGTDGSQLDQYIGHVAYNDPSGYRRNMLNSGIRIEYRTADISVSSITGHQLLDDRMRMDQDFTPADIFTLEQNQHANTVSQEIVIRSQHHRRWQWTAGVFGFYQWLETSAPVVFKRQGISELIEQKANSAFPSSPQAPRMQLSIFNDRLPIEGRFSTPQMSLAIYHQSTWNDILVEGLSFSAGLRLDYERMSLDYRSQSDPMNFGFSLQMGPMRLEDNDMQAASLLAGKMKHDYLQLLPRFSLQYEWAEANNIYATVARGYRSGGYNIQMFNDLAQYQLMNSMKQAMLASQALSPVAQMIGQMMPETEIDVDAAALYKPEHAWNYEVGTHLTLFNGRMTADAALFLMNTLDQQVSQFSENGMGRITRNAGKSRSLGAEISVASEIARSWLLNVGYGFIEATFVDYRTILNGGTEEDFSGKHVPFIPQHTLNIGLQHVMHFDNSRLLDRIRIALDFNAAGRIYWTEDNLASQPFYGTLNGRISFEKGAGVLALWIRNALNQKYQSFYFESMGNRFMQRGKPIHAGLELQIRF